MYTILFILSLLFYYFGSRQNSLIFFYIWGVVLALFSGLRGGFVGRDTPQYILVFDDIVSNNNNFINEPGYRLFVKLVDMIGGTQHLVFLVIASVTVYCFCKFILRYSTKPYLSLLIFVFVGPFYFAIFNQMRQYLAIGVFLAYLLPLAENKKLFKFLFFTACTAFFAHISVILLIPFYFIVNFNMRLFVKFAVFIVFNAAFGFVLYLILQTPYSYFIVRRSQIDMDLTLVFLQVLISFIFLFFENRLTDKDDKQLTFFNMAFISFILLTSTFIYPNTSAEVFLRMNNYLFPFMIVLVPNITQLFTRKNRVVIVSILCCFLCLYYFRTAILLGEEYNLAPYSFSIELFS
jgi:hypothetical protein